MKFCIADTKKCRVACESFFIPSRFVIHTSREGEGALLCGHTVEKQRQMKHMSYRTCKQSTRSKGQSTGQEVNRGQKVVKNLEEIGSPTFYEISPDPVLQTLAAAWYHLAIHMFTGVNKANTQH